MNSHRYLVNAYLAIIAMPLFLEAAVLIGEVRDNLGVMRYENPFR